MSDTSKALDRMYALHKHQTATLERIATALEVLAMSAMWRDNGGNAEPGFATSIKIAADHFKEARDA